MKINYDIEILKARLVNKLGTGIAEISDNEVISYLMKDYTNSDEGIIIVTDDENVECIRIVHNTIGGYMELYSSDNVCEINVVADWHFECSDRLIRCLTSQDVAIRKSVSPRMNVGVLD